MEIKKAPLDAHAPKKGPGRPFGAMTRVKRDLRDWCRKDGKKAFEELRRLALDNPDSWVRLAAVKLWIEYGYGKPLSADGENAGGPAIVNVTSVRGDISATPRPLLRDGRDPFEQHATPSGSRPIGRAPVVEPSQHRLFEGEPEPKP